MKFKKACWLLAAGLTLGCSAGASLAQEWPTETVRIVVPFPPGGTTDIMGRLIADKLRVSLGRPVLVENLAGAGGRIGAERVARSAPDGHTLLVGSPGPLASYQFLYKSMSYDSRTAFDPVIALATLPQVLVVRADSNITTVAGLVADLKQRADKVSYGTPGVGSSQHLTTELFKAATGTRPLNVSYKGSAPMLADVIAGTTDFAFDQLTSALGLIKSGRLRALAVTSPKRSEQVPEVPTLTEAGVNVDYGVWFALVAPRGTPGAIIKRLNEDANKALADPEVRERIAGFGATPAGGSPESLARLISSEEESVKGILKSTKIELD